MSTNAPPPPPPVTDIDLTQFAEIVNTARTDNDQALATPLVATAAADGYPDVAYRGSTMVWDADHLAWWERSKRETLANLGANTRVCVWVRNPVRDRRSLRFYGEARVVEDGAELQAIWERVLQVEKDMDKERKGIAVVVRVDRVRAGPFDVQRRSPPA